MLVGQERASFERGQAGPPEHTGAAGHFAADESRVTVVEGRAALFDVAAVDENTVLATQGFRGDLQLPDHGKNPAGIFQTPDQMEHRNFFHHTC